MRGSREGGLAEGTQESWMGQGGSGALTPCPRCCLGLVHWGGGLSPALQ